MYGRFRERAVRKRRKKKKDEGQSSLDAFGGSKPHEATPSDDPPVPSMVDLDRLEAAHRNLHAPPQNPVASDHDGPRSFNMPSLGGHPKSQPVGGLRPQFHDLDRLYPSAPVPLKGPGMVIHYATLTDITGCNQVMDWVADGHAAIVEMQRLMNRTTEFNQALSTLQGLIEQDMGGQIIRMTSSRLMCLPDGCRGVRGTDMEAFASDEHDFNGVEP